MAARSPKSGEAKSRRLGLTLANPTEEQRKVHELTDHGLLVTRVTDGPARKAGVQDGDVVLMLNNSKLKDVDTFRDVARALPVDKAVSILVQRQGSPIFLALKLDAQ